MDGFNLIPWDPESYFIAADYAEENNCLLPKAIRDKVLPLDVENGDGKGIINYRMDLEGRYGDGDGDGYGLCEGIYFGVTFLNEDTTLTWDCFGYGYGAGEGCGLNFNGEYNDIGE